MTDSDSADDSITIFICLAVLYIPRATAAAAALDTGFYLYWK